MDSLQPHVGTGVGDLRCLGLETGRQRWDGEIVDLGSVVRVGVYLLAGEGVSWTSLACCPYKSTLWKHAPDALTGGAVVVEPPLVLLVVPPAVVVTLVVVPVVVPGVVVLLVEEVVVGLTLVVKVVALPGWHWE
jgi:hypothetical protein